MKSHRRPRILLLGGDGQLGWELQTSLAPIGELVTASIDGLYGPAIDLTDRKALAALVREVKPGLLVNAAAYTAVDKAESDERAAALVNEKAPAQLGELALETGATVVHFSTDFVFSGEQTQPYREDDPANPINVYGQTKLAGEQALLATGANALIIRTSWLYGLRGHNFLLTILRLLKERDEVSIVDDQIGAPTWCRMLAIASAQVLAQILNGAAEPHSIRGIYHLTAGGQTSWYGFAKRIGELVGSRCRILPIGSADYPSPARRPAYSVLDNAKITDVFGVKLPDWDLSLQQCLSDRAQ